MSNSLLGEFAFHSNQTFDFFLKDLQISGLKAVKLYNKANWKVM